jgi:hypothetical protein
MMALSSTASTFGSSFLRVAANSFSLASSSSANSIKTPRSSAAWESSSKGLTVELIRLSSPTSPWAFSWSSQNFGAVIRWLISWMRLFLPARSKTVSQMNNPLNQVLAGFTQFRIHVKRSVWVCEKFQWNCRRFAGRWSRDNSRIVCQCQPPGRCSIYQLHAAEAFFPAQSSMPSLTWMSLVSGSSFVLSSPTAAPPLLDQPPRVAGGIAKIEQLKQHRRRYSALGQFTPRKLRNRNLRGQPLARNLPFPALVGFGGFLLAEVLADHRPGERFLGGLGVFREQSLDFSKGTSVKSSKYMGITSSGICMNFFIIS